MAKQLKFLSRQAGAVLVVSLIILLILTILGVSVMRTTTLEEKMAAATRDKDIAFQSAEAALKAAEDFIQANDLVQANFKDDCTGAVNGITSGLCTVPTTGSQRWDDTAICGGSSVWVGACSEALTNISNVSKQPRYIIEFLKTVNVGGDLLQQGNLQDIPMGELVDYFRITAVGYGGTADATVMLQSTFAKN